MLSVIMLLTHLVEEDDGAEPGAPAGVVLQLRVELVAILRRGGHLDAHLVALVFSKNMVLCALIGYENVSPSKPG